MKGFVVFAVICQLIVAICGTFVAPPPLPPPQPQVIRRVNIRVFNNPTGPVPPPPGAFGPGAPIPPPGAFGPGAPIPPPGAFGPGAPIPPPGAFGPGAPIPPPSSAVNVRVVNTPTAPIPPPPGAFGPRGPIPVARPC